MKKPSTKQERQVRIARLVPALKATGGSLADLYEVWLREHGICTGCGCGRLKCDVYRAEQRKCCPDCEHE